VRASNAPTRLLVSCATSSILLALAVPAAAWLEQSALLLAVEAILALFVAAFIFWTRSRLRAKI
jgi:hypothetical protein